MFDQSGLAFFKNIMDPRQPWKTHHDLYDIIVLTVCGVLGGAEGWEEIEDFGKIRHDWLKQYGSFNEGIPSHDTIARVMSQINPKQLQDAFIDWMQECVKLTTGTVVAID